MERVTDVVRGDGDVSYIHLTEFPDGTIRIEGIRESDQYENAYQIIGIRFSVEAIRELIPMLNKAISKK